MGSFFLWTVFVLWIANKVSAYGFGKVFLGLIKFICVLIIGIYILGFCLA